MVVHWKSSLNLSLPMPAAVLASFLCASLLVALGHLFTFLLAVAALKLCPQLFIDLS